MGRLTALAVKRLVKPGRYGDGGGLWLQVRDAERRSWLFRYKLHGKARQMGLGALGDVSLAEARNAAQECRRLLRDGIDPIEHRRNALAEAKAAAKSHTFREIADLYIAAHEAGWRNAKHRAQWRSTLETFVYPKVGDRQVKAINVGDVMGILEPIWQAKPETSSRVRGRIEAVLDYAKARGWRSGENPARWRGHLVNLLPARSRIAKVKHHAALPWGEIGAFMAKLRAENGTAARALELAVLTSARTGEVIGARWAEFDLNDKVWTVPAGRMKAGREHRVPLSDAALTVLKKMAPAKTAADGFVFPGGRDDRPLSNMAMTMLLRRMGRDDLTVHGFRATFKTWASESTGYHRETIESALAHVLKDKTESAYLRGDAIAKRARLMAEWAAFCARKPGKAAVVPIRGRRRAAAASPAT